VQQGNRELATVLRAFAQNVRASLYNDETPYRLENELRLVRNFIQIQEYRQPERIRFELDVNSELLQCLVPKLCIQPLLENAVLHGMDGRDSGVVQVRIGRIGQNIYISVEDNGVGIPPQRLEQVRLIIYGDVVNAEKLLNRSYSALRNVHQRLELIYGKQYGLTINSVEGRYTRTEMLLPMQYERKGGEEGELSDC
jgi:two-component system sensor histidine kinase YesM